MNRGQKRPRKRLRRGTCALPSLLTIGNILLGRSPRPCNDLFRSLRDPLTLLLGQAVQPGSIGEEESLFKVSNFRLRNCIKKIIKYSNLSSFFT